MTNYYVNDTYRFVDIGFEIGTFHDSNFDRVTAINGELQCRLFVFAGSHGDVGKITSDSKRPNSVTRL